MALASTQALPSLLVLLSQDLPRLFCARLFSQGSPFGGYNSTFLIS